MLRQRLGRLLRRASRRLLRGLLPWLLRQRLGRLLRRAARLQSGLPPAPLQNFLLRAGVRFVRLPGRNGRDHVRRRRNQAGGAARTGRETRACAAPTAQARTGPLGVAPSGAVTVPSSHQPKPVTSSVSLLVLKQCSAKSATTLPGIRSGTRPETLRRQNRLQCFTRRCRYIQYNLAGRARQPALGCLVSG